MSEALIFNLKHGTKEELEFLKPEDYLTFSYDDSIELKHRVNMEKNKLNDYAQSVDLVNNPYIGLQGPNGILCKHYNAEHASNAFMKMYEMTPEIGKKIRNRDHYVSLHLAEAPGSFILAINHYLRTHKPGINWHWFASSFRNINQLERDRGYLGDGYGLMKKYPNKWIFGADGTGDITNPDNLRAFNYLVVRLCREEISTQSPEMGSRCVDLVTSDVKYAPPTGPNYDEEENINIPVNYGQVLGALNTLKSGGCAFLKQFSYYESPSIILLYILTNCFESVHIIKPLTSKPTNSEIYVWCVGFIPKHREHLINHLSIYLKNIRTTPPGDPVPSIMHSDEIPEAFYLEVLDISKKLAEKQIEAINNMLPRLKEIQQGVKPVDSNIQQMKNMKWIRDFDFIRLPDNGRL